MKESGMNLEDKDIEKFYPNFTPENFKEDSKRKRAFIYVLNNVGATSKELERNTNAYRGCFYALWERGLLNRAMDRSLAQYRYWVKKKYQDYEG